VGCWQFVKKEAQKQILQQSDAVLRKKNSSSPALVDIYELQEYFCELLKTWLLSSLLVPRLNIETYHSGLIPDAGFVIGNSSWGIGSNSELLGDVS